MGEYHLRKDGTIAIRVSDDVFYFDTVANFILDGGPAPAALEFEADERIYTQGVRHALHKNNNVVGGGPLPWPDGDSVIASLNDLLTTKNTRDAAALEAANLEMTAKVKALSGQ